MIKTWKPFQSKIQLHIETGFLQSLWDKYVPASFDAYERISLIYLNGTPDSHNEPDSRIEVLIRLLLNNVRMQINILKNQMLMNQHTVYKSFAGMTNYYLEQLRRTDFHVYRPLNRYVAYLEQTERENLRYQDWQRDNQAIQKIIRDNQVLHIFCLLYTSPSPRDPQ
jgi:hypothetical protein